MRLIFSSPLTLVLTTAHFCPLDCTSYMKAAVEALSLRSHGGANGHGAYLAKLEVKRKKAHATMVKNGT